MFDASSFVYYLMSKIVSKQLSVQKLFVIHSSISLLVGIPIVFLLNRSKNNYDNVIEEDGKKQKAILEDEVPLYRILLSQFKSPMFFMILITVCIFTLKINLVIVSIDSFIKYKNGGESGHFI